MDNNWRFAQCFGDKGEVEEVTEADIISTVEFDHTGDYLATGDKGGRVVLFERNENKKGCEYKFHTEFQSHEPEFDYLKSLEIEEKINRIKWCKRQNQSQFLLSTNDKTIKLWKIFEKSLKVVSENNLSASHPSPPTSLTLPQIITPPHPSLTSNLRLPRMSHHDTIVAAVPRKVYANAHAYHINSLSINSDGETYLSADDLRINLWNLGISDQSFNIVDIKPSCMEDLTEVITAADFHPLHCNLFMYSSSKGTIKLADMRDAALCDRHAKLYEEEEDPSNKSFFSEIISSISDVKFSSDGRYILSRDYLTLKIWDLHMENRPVKTINIHDNLRTKLCELYENDCIFDKFECTFSGDGSQVMTGSYDNYFHIYNSDPSVDNDVVLQADKSAFKAKKIGGKGLAGVNKKEDINMDNIDFGKKILHGSWHPQEDTIAIGATNVSNYDNTKATTKLSQAYIWIQRTLVSLLIIFFPNSLSNFRNIFLFIGFLELLIQSISFRSLKIINPKPINLKRQLISKPKTEDRYSSSINPDITAHNLSNSLSISNENIPVFSQPSLPNISKPKETISDVDEMEWCPEFESNDANFKSTFYDKGLKPQSFFAPQDNQKTGLENLFNQVNLFDYNTNNIVNNSNSHNKTSKFQDNLNQILKIHLLKFTIINWITLSFIRLLQLISITSIKKLLLIFNQDFLNFITSYEVLLPIQLTACLVTLISASFNNIYGVILRLSTLIYLITQIASSNLPQLSINFALSVNLLFSILSSLLSILYFIYT